MKWLMLTLFCWSSVVFAEAVDIFAFNSPETEQRAVALAKSLRCPQCQNQNLVESNSSIAMDLRLEVYQMVNQGKTDDEVIQIMTKRFGDFVRYDPPFARNTLMLWLFPLVFLFFSLWACLFYLKKRQQVIELPIKQQQQMKKFLQQQARHD